MRLSLFFTALAVACGSSDRDDPVSTEGTGGRVPVGVQTGGKIASEPTGGNLATGGVSDVVGAGGDAGGAGGFPVGAGGEGGVLTDVGGAAGASEQVGGEGGLAAGGSEPTGGAEASTGGTEPGTGGSAPTGGVPAGFEPANPCATPGATYLQSFELISGNCPELPDVILNITEDGLVPDAVGLECQVRGQNGCRAQNSNCVFTDQGCEYTFTTDVTFAEDGSSAEGLETVTVICDDGSSCAGTYRVEAERR